MLDVKTWSPILELFPCSQNPVAVSLLAHWYGIAWQWSVLVFLTNFTLQQPLWALWAPTMVPSFWVCSALRCGTKLDCMWSLTSCSCCVQALLNSPYLRSHLWAQNKKERSAPTQPPVTSSSPLCGQSLPCDLEPVLSSVSQLSNFWGPLLDFFLVPDVKIESWVQGPIVDYLKSITGYSLNRLGLTHSEEWKK